MCLKKNSVREGVSQLFVEAGCHWGFSIELEFLKCKLWYNYPTTLVHNFKAGVGLPLDKVIWLHKNKLRGHFWDETDGL